jgi:integrase
MKVTIENLNGRLRLRWTCPETGKRKNLALGVEESTTGRSFAATIKDRIETDAKYGYYDSTLLKYRLRTIGKNKSEITTVELFALFTNHKFKRRRKPISQSSVDARYKPIGVMLAKHLEIQAADVDKRWAEKFADVCEDTLKPDTARARIWLLKSAWDWAKGKYELGSENPWEGVADRFQSEPVQPVAPFTREEVIRILQAFRVSPYYSYYADYVLFRFNLATRPGEASALKWKNLSSDFQTVWIGRSSSRGETGSTKTKKDRTINLNTAVSVMLKTRFDRVKPAPDDLVFTTKEGLSIDDRNFRRRAWSSILSQLGIPYRKPYTTRKTAINHALKAGANYIEVAAAAGHDPQTMHKYYAEAIQKESVFVSFD